VSKRNKVNEEVAGVSVSGGAVPSITDATTNYALQVKRKTKKTILKRAAPPYNVKGIVGDNT
jgi:hypothetical protein